jgi:hypothetical protein
MVKINADSGEKVEAFLLTKDSSYSWEREWRFVAYDKGGGYRSISPWALQAVVLGSLIEATMKQEVMRLVARWKPLVSLFGVVATGADLRLQLLDGPQFSTRARITPPIQECLSREPLRRCPPSAQLLDYLGSVLPEHRQSDLDIRIRNLVANLKAVELSLGERIQDVAAAAAVHEEGIDFLREIVDRSGSAIPGYGDVAVVLYRLLCMRSS